MAEFTNREIVEVLLDNDGIYPGDPRASRIYEYRNVHGSVAWAAFWSAWDDMAASPYVAEFVLLWDKELGHVADIGVLEKQKKEEATCQQ